MNAHDALNTAAVLGVFLLMALPSLIGHAHDRRIDRQLREAEQGRPASPGTSERQPQNSSSKETEPSTATWYADGRRSKKLVSSCTP
ncbi:hypothetical protein [Streptomyces silvensis]|uniref:hypothetical protein n=1 Tax=Streptomyces silvensis TaxID=1765722 RepID=UPI00099F006F|nr:hypothetical protein [Streptomyces silvensis]